MGLLEAKKSVHGEDVALGEPPQRRWEQTGRKEGLCCRKQEDRPRASLPVALPALGSPDYSPSQCPQLKTSPCEVGSAVWAGRRVAGALSCWRVRGGSEHVCPRVLASCPKPKVAVNEVGAGARQGPKLQDHAPLCCSCSHSSHLRGVLALRVPASTPTCLHPHGFSLSLGRGWGSRPHPVGCAG